MSAWAASGADDEPLRTKSVDPLRPGRSVGSDMSQSPSTSVATAASSGHSRCVVSVNRNSAPGFARANASRKKTQSRARSAFLFSATT